MVIRQPVSFTTTKMAEWTGRLKQRHKFLTQFQIGVRERWRSFRARLSLRFISEMVIRQQVTQKLLSLPPRRQNCFRSFKCFNAFGMC